MKLRELIHHLKTPDLLLDDLSASSILELDVVFNTNFDGDFELLSVYLVDGVINVDIGEVGFDADHSLEHPTPAPGLQEWTKATNWKPSNGGKR